MKQRYLYAYILCIACSLYQQLSTVSGTRFGATGVGTEAALWTMRDQSVEGLIPLNEWNQFNNHLVHQISTQEVTQFLNEEIQKAGFHPELFRYFVSLDGDWQVIPLSNGYGFIIPGPGSSYFDFAKSLVSSTQAQPQYALNIDNLNNLVKQLQNNHKNESLLSKYDHYHLTIIKALIQAQSKGLFSNIKNVMVQGGLAALGATAAQKYPPLQYVTVALANIYPLLAGNKEWIQFQQALDAYILGTHDIHLIETYIADLKKQIQEEKENYVTKLWSYVPGTSQQNPLEQRLDTIQKYLKDNRFELEQLPKFKKAGKQR